MVVISYMTERFVNEHTQTNIQLFYIADVTNYV